MEILSGKTILRKKGKEFTEVSVDDALNDVSILAFYFGAHWCPPCRLFMPQLSAFYDKLKEKDASFEILFISTEEKGEMQNYMLECQGDWLAVPNEPEKLAEQLYENYEITYMPTVVIVKDGKVITNNGQEDIEMHEEDCYETWMSGKGALTAADLTVGPWTKELN